MLDLPTVLFVLSLIFIANVAEASDSARFKRAVNVLYIVVNLPLFVAGLTLAVLPPATLATTALGEAFGAPRPAGVTLLLIAVWGLLATLPETRRLLARWLPLDPSSSVHTLALILAGYLIGANALVLSQGGLEGLAETSEASSVGQIVIAEMFYAVVALMGVGLFVRRHGWKLVERLGLAKPTLAQLKGSVRWILALVALQWITGVVLYYTNPEQAELLKELNSLLLGNMDTVWDWFLLAAAAAAGEEILFRGALQPVLGLWATSLLFAMAHIQYGLTPVTILVFGIGLVLGLVRRRTNTSVAIFVHFGYNFILGLLALLAPYLETLVDQPF